MPSLNTENVTRDAISNENKKNNKKKTLKESE